MELVEEGSLLITKWTVHTQDFHKQELAGHILELKGRGRDTKVALIVLGRGSRQLKGGEPRILLGQSGAFNTGSFQGPECDKETGSQADQDGETDMDAHITSYGL
jgi:hypothetical protein